VATFNNFPYQYGKICKKNPSKTSLTFACDFLLIAAMQKLTQNKALTMTFPNSQLPNSTFCTTKTPTMR
jgi:hypothetical protein